MGPTFVGERFDGLGVLATRGPAKSSFDRGVDARRCDRHRPREVSTSRRPMGPSARSMGRAPPGRSEPPRAVHRGRERRGRSVAVGRSRAKPPRSPITSEAIVTGGSRSVGRGRWVAVGGSRSVLRGRWVAVVVAVGWVAVGSSRSLGAVGELVHGRGAANDETWITFPSSSPTRGRAPRPAACPRGRSGLALGRRRRRCTAITLINVKSEGSLLA